MGRNKKFHNTKIYLEPISPVRVAANQDRGGNHVADPCLNSSDFCYHIEYSRLMALRILREEAARQSEDECRPARAVGLRGTVINVLLKPEERRPLTPMPHMPLEFWRFHGSDRPDHYREHMHECLQLAGMTAGPEHRAVLVASKRPLTAALFFF